MYLFLDFYKRFRTKILRRLRVEEMGILMYIFLSHGVYLLNFVLLTPFQCATEDSRKTKRRGNANQTRTPDIYNSRIVTLETQALVGFLPFRKW